jgi:hypothetical protein
MSLNGIITFRTTCHTIQITTAMNGNSLYFICTVYGVKEKTRGEDSDKNVGFL